VTNIYAVTDVRVINDTLAAVSLVNLFGVAAPYNTWSASDNGEWIGSVVVDITTTPIAYYYVPPQSEYPGVGGGSAPVVKWPYMPGHGATYTQGIHPSWGMQYSIDMAPEGGPYAYAVAGGTVSWVCNGTYDQEIKLSTDQGDFVYGHLVPGTTAQGHSFNQSDLIGPLITSPIQAGSDPTCGSRSTGTHIHLGFTAPSGVIQFESCVLDVGTSIFNCNGTLVYVGGTLPDAGGFVLPPATAGPGTEVSQQQPEGVGGGDHIWDGPVTGLVQLVSTAIAPIPTHQTIGLVGFMDNIAQPGLDGWEVVSSLGLVYMVPALLIFSMMMISEIVRTIIVIWRWILRIIPTAG
jgi:hypothetical protein